MASAYEQLMDDLKMINAENARLRALLREANGLLARHHTMMSTATLGKVCPVCSKNETEFYPNNIFGRIDAALAERKQ